MILEVGTDSPEASVLNQPTLRNNTKDLRVHIKLPGVSENGLKRERDSVASHPSFINREKVSPALHIVAKYFFLYSILTSQY